MEPGVQEGPVVRGSSWRMNSVSRLVRVSTEHENVQGLLCVCGAECEDAQTKVIIYPTRHPGQNPHKTQGLLPDHQLLLIFSSQPPPPQRCPSLANLFKPFRGLLEPSRSKTLIFLYLLLPGRISGHRKVIIACLLCARHCSSAENKVDNRVQLLLLHEKHHLLSSAPHLKLISETSSLELVG